MLALLSRPYPALITPFWPWIVPIRRSLQGIVGDVLADGIQGVFVAHDVFVIPSLPEWHTNGVAHFVDPAGRKRFECPHDFRQAVAFGRDGSEIRLYRTRLYRNCSGRLPSLCIAYQSIPSRSGLADGSSKKQHAGHPREEMPGHMSD